MFTKQLEAYEKFRKLKIGALFMKMGTGKTKVALDLVKYNKVDLLVYICPFSTKDNIQTEINKWGLNCDYIIIGYETIQSSTKTYFNLFQKMKDKKCFIIADESIFIKNEKTNRFKRLLKLRELCEYALILNGTPLTKNEWDLYNQMHFLSPLILNMSREEFLNKFFKEIIYKKRDEKEKRFYKFSEVNASVLTKLIEPYVFYADLIFDKKENIYFNYVPYFDETYYIIKQNLLQNMKFTNFSQIKILLQKLHYIASCYTIKLNEVIKHSQNKQVIIYCNYLDEIDYLHKNMDCFVITGETKERSHIIEKFKQSQKPLVMTYGVGSYSLNLQFCQEIIISSLPFFDYGKLEQAMYRIKRLGQESDINYKFFLTDLGISRLILDNIQNKKKLEDLVKENIEKGDYGQWLKNM